MVVRYWDLDLLLSTHLIDGLICLSVRWMQPIQQHGRRLPSCNSVTVRSTWFLRVAACLTVTVQQIHSLRASGVILFHAASALGLAANALSRSEGILCVVPPGIPFIAIIYILHAPKLLQAFEDTTALDDIFVIPLDRF